MQRQVLVTDEKPIFDRGIVFEPQEGFYTFVPDEQGVVGATIAASPLVKQPGTMPYRIVLKHWGDEFAVFTEYFGGEDFFHYADAGDYFPYKKETGPARFRSLTYREAFVRALHCFAERTAKQAGFCESICREELAVA